VTAAAPAAVELASAAAALLAIDAAGLGGAVVRAHAGPAREAWWGAVRRMLPPGTPVRRLPAGATDDRVLGGLDLPATLVARRPVVERGILAESDGGLLAIPMAERLPAATVGHLVAALDAGTCRVERDGISAVHPARFGVVAFDEAEPDEPGVAPALAERLAIHLDLAALPATQEWPVAEPGEIARARARLPGIPLDPAQHRALEEVAAALGVGSLRAAWYAARAARAAAALAASPVVTEDEVRLAVQLVLLPRATRLPPAEAEPVPPPPPDEPEAGPPADESAPADQPLADRLVEAALATLPPAMLASLAARRAARGARGEGGRSGERRSDPRHGRTIGSRRGDPRRGRLDLLGTLRAAAPWQRLRGAAPADPGSRLRVAPGDLRVRRLRQRVGTTVLFAVDASGSQALHRLAEAKGAIELLLAESYVRRDKVALVAFRGRGAELVLPPTRSLARAKRALAGVPGGGGTPLAAALDLLATLALGVRRAGGRPLAVVLTDGRANVARDGEGGRERAEREALEAARRLAAESVPALVIDCAPRPNAWLGGLARAAGARYLPLPARDAAAISAAVRAAAD